MIEGGAGNDVIIESHSDLPLDIRNIILGGDGKDFIVTSDDISPNLRRRRRRLHSAGTRTLFGQGARNNLPKTGNEGDDWIEEGTQDGAPGDTGALPSPTRCFDDVPGNDIFVGGGGFDEMIGEGGDDIFVGSDAQDKMDGMSGFDWITYKNDHVRRHRRHEAPDLRSGARHSPIRSRRPFSRWANRPIRSSTASPKWKVCRDRQFSRHSERR